MRTIALACVLVIAWPFHHKPTPHPAPDIILGCSSLEIADDLDKLREVHDDYPWLRPWAEPALDVINQLQSGRDKNADDDLRQLRYYMWQLEQLEQNDAV